MCVCDCVNQQAPKGPNTFIGKKLLKSPFLKVQTLCLMVKSCQIPNFPWLPWGKRSHRCGNPMVYEAKDIYIYIYPSLPKAILNLVFVKKTELNIAFRGSCRSRPVTVMSFSCCRLQIVQILTNLDSQESKGLWTIKPLPTRALV